MADAVPEVQPGGISSSCWPVVMAVVPDLSGAGDDAFVIPDDANLVVSNEGAPCPHRILLQMVASFDRLRAMTNHSNTLPPCTGCNFEEQLRCLARTSSGPYLRPFTPNAQWRDARVFVVGTNPATPLRSEFGSFDAYWDALTLDPAAFQTVYRAQRNGKTSLTTGRVERFAAPLVGVGVLRTNAAALPSGSWKKLPAKVRREQLEIGRQILRALVEICRPTAILCHGQEGVKAVSTLFATALDPYVALDRQTVRVPLAAGGEPVRLFAYPHLSGMGVKPGFAVGLMGDELEALAWRLARELGA